MASRCSCSSSVKSTATKVDVSHRVDKVKTTSLQRTISLVMIGCAIAVGCGDPDDEQVISDPVDTSRMLVESQLAELDVVMRDAARHRAVEDAIERRVQRQGDRPFEDRVDDGLRYSMVFDEMYVDGDLSARFVDHDGLTDYGRRTVDYIDDADRHALQAETLHREAIDGAVDALAADPSDRAESPGFAPTVDEVEALVDLVADTVDERGADDGVALIVDAVSTVDDDSDTPPGLERFRDYNIEEAQRFSKRADQIAELELYIADAALRYAREMRHKYLERKSWTDIRDAGGTTDIILGRMRDTLGDLHGADVDGIDAVFLDLEPGHPQYRALVDAIDDYRQFVDDGGWRWIHPVDLDDNASPARINALRERLAAEGIDTVPDDADDDFDPGVVDDRLIDGVKYYQETHQFVADGEPTHGFWRSINIPATERLEQMELTLQRWRESLLDDDEDFIFVNIPLFEAQVWTDGEPQMEFSVVVGNNQRRCDEESEEWIYPDATPVMMAEFDHVMLNPPWYVPERIVEQTLEPRLEDNEDYYEEEGYEEVEMADGRTVVRQNPGDDNALGRAKFIFPNEDNIYLHDTPHQQYFDYGIRAFSHGCIRVSEPIELARYLIDWEGRDDIDVDEIVDGDTTRQIDFDRELPVFLEYYTVWVDDEGRPNFLADIYEKDAHRLSDEPDEFFECDPAEFATDEDTEADPDDDADDEDASDDDTDGDAPDTDEGEDEHTPDITDDVGP